ncbi:hypothetical protein GM415_06035 [Pseudodesulfovibrio cashew]|uniref:N-acetyltransferase domain-containing protein n=1 Tax=Pseudodesulfovibrio cashew TaxID=2678688 RepID=A0A6I6JAH2_9BACT|nr:hypothetical protein [Pseudodesulfovibrio cashew]QGY39695.1 hypothetical protein GM415_06035 [Pseudodesulfovibrio cashew]
MSVDELTRRPSCMSHFPDDEDYRWLRLHEEGEVYGYAAFREREDALELHLTLARWGPGVRRGVREDAKWLKTEARRLGKSKIIGVRINTLGDFDPRLFRFARLFGFTDCCVLQTATLYLE